MSAFGSGTDNAVDLSRPKPTLKAIVFGADSLKRMVLGILFCAPTRTNPVYKVRQLILYQR